MVRLREYLYSSEFLAGPVEAVELVVLDNLNQLLGILGVGGVAGFLEAVAPALVVSDLQVEEKCVSLAVAQEVRVVLE